MEKANFNKLRTHLENFNNCLKIPSVVIFLFLVTVVLLILQLLCPVPAFSETNEEVIKIGKWKRFEVSYTNPSFKGNPFDVEFYGSFTHKSSGKILKQPGFYAGRNHWKIYFMPDNLGEWTFHTSSPDPDLNEKTGSFICIPSDLPGRLLPDGKRWKLEDGKYDFPIMIPTRQWFKSTKTDDGIGDFISWAANTVGARIIGTTLVYFSHAKDEIPYIKGKEGVEFNIPMWDRLNSHFDRMRDTGLGHYIMFYSDEDESPNTKGILKKSEEELRLFRYTIARFAPYPIVMWDTGIDIGETRPCSWIDWFADWFNRNDPWQHPVGSRTGGGSGGKHPINGTYYSDGTPELPDHTSFVNTWKKRSIPTAFTDRWREGYMRGDFDQNKIRQATWEMGLTGGTAIYVSGNENGGYLTDNYARDFKAASECGYATRFFREHLSDFGKLYPHNELLISSKKAILSANIGVEYVAYLLPFCGPIRINLSEASDTLKYQWYNPRRGNYHGDGSIAQNSIQTFNPPDSNDWVLHIVKQEKRLGSMITDDTT